MERPGFNPQALARKPGSQRSGANKEKKQAARRVRRRCVRAGMGAVMEARAMAMGRSVCFATFTAYFGGLYKTAATDSERGICIAGPAAAASKYALGRPMLANCCVVLRLRDPAKEETPAQS